MTRLNEPSNEKNVPFDPTSFHDIEFKQPEKEKIVPSITQQQGHSIVNNPASPKHASLFKRIGDFFSSALDFLTRPFKPTQTIRATHIETPKGLKTTKPASTNLLEIQAEEFVAILREIQAIQTQNKAASFEEPTSAPKETLAAPPKLELPDDFEEVIALGNQNIEPAPIKNQAYEETIAANVESMRILREIQEENLQPLLQEKLEAAYKQLEESSVAIKALSPFDPNFGRVQETIKKRAETLLRDIQNLTDKPEIMRLPVIRTLQTLSGQASTTPLDPQSTQLLQTLLEELSKSGGGIRSLELTASIARTPVSDLVKIWEEYSLRLLTADSAPTIPLSTLGLAFQNINRNFNYTQIVSENPFITHSLKADEAYQQTYMNRLAQLAKLTQGIKTSRTNILNVVQNSIRIFELNPASATAFREVLTKAEAIYTANSPVSEKKTQLELTRKEFMRLHKEWLDAIKSKIDLMSETEKLKAKNAIKEAIPEYNTKMYQSGQFDSLIAITAQWQMPAFTDTLFDTIKNGLTAQTKLAETDPNTGLDTFNL